MNSRTCAVYKSIVEYKSVNDGASPSVRQIMKATGTTSQSIVAYHLNLLEEAGLISRPKRPGVSRHISVIGGKWVMDAPGVEERLLTAFGQEGV